MSELEFLKPVIDETDVCPYLPEQIARMPLSISNRRLNPQDLDTLLAHGYRRTGWFFYRTQCPNCAACEPMRLEVEHFQTTRSQRRAEKMGDTYLETRIGPPQLDAQRIRMFDAHRVGRHLTSSKTPSTASDYRSFLLNSHFEILEISLWLDEVLIGISITDVGDSSLSAVYCFFDPAYARYSLGTYAILKQIELARATDRRWLYLGLYVADNEHLRYKAKFAPHERRIANQWQAS
ncbi:arginyltransferase [Aureliella helgolandensis]|uniref:Aspartate/glutamate leucyltransferase n=1 Tax=Aureliella helgolandensis TaxID=2527968 RepID=A0A518G2M9_9BACT|nr:arginyltransferase [Aureliella helgolandensis]QDV22861.1 arginyl-tRNA-protein transferase [Aureliella helgolandensis]